MKLNLLKKQEQQKQKSGVFDIRIAEMKQELAVLQKTLEEHLKESDKIQNTYNELQKQTEAIKQEVVLASEGILNVKLSQGKAQSAIESYNKQIELITDRKLSIDQELAVLESNSEIASGEIDAAEKERSLTEAKFGDTKQIYKNKSEALETAKQNESKAVEKCAKISAALQSDSARLKAIKEMEDDYEGYAFSVKKVLSLCKSNPDFGKGICGAVAQIIRVSAEYETAIEVALAQAYQNIVTETEEDAKKAIEYLKKGRYGRATFLPLTAVNGRRFESETVTRPRLDCFAVKATIPGKTKITTISEPSAATPHVSIAESTATVAVGSTVKLTIEGLYPANATITWSSGTQAKATVASDGTVTGVASGSSVITASITVGGTAYTDTCTVTVTGGTG